MSQTPESCLRPRTRVSDLAHRVSDLAHRVSDQKKIKNGSCHAPLQVLDTKQELPSGDLASREANKAAYKSALQKFCADAVAAQAMLPDAEKSDDDEDEQEDGAYSTKRLANMYYVQALEHIVKLTTGMELSHFKPLRRPVALREEQSRVFKPESQVRQGGRSDYFLSLVKSPESEVVECPVKRRKGDNLIVGPPWLILTLDQGSVGWQGALWLYQKQGLQGWWIHDPWHRCWNDLRLAISSAGLWPVVREMILCMNHRAGPWERASFFQQTKNSVQQMARYGDCENPFFLHWYPEICKDIGVFNEQGYGTKPHLQKVWRIMLTDSAFKHKGQKVRWGRWCSFFDAGEEFIKHYSLMLPPMYSHGIKSGWWKSLDQTPLVDSRNEDLGIAGAVTARVQSSGGVRPPRAVKDSNEAVQTLRMQCKNALHLTCTIMSNITTKRLFASLLVVCAPARASMGKAMKRCIQSPASSKQQFLEWSCGSQNASIMSVIEAAVLSEHLQKAYFALEPDRAEVDEEDVLYEDEMAQRHFGLATAVAGHMARTMMEFTSTPPYLFLPLLSDVEAEQRAALEKLRDLWAAVQCLEARNDMSASNWVAALLWPACPSIRQIFIVLQA
eukprot:2835254-Amphidinium_carterae.2